MIIKPINKWGPRKDFLYYFLKPFDHLLFFNKQWVVVPIHHQFHYRPTKVLE